MVDIFALEKGRDTECNLLCAKSLLCAKYRLPCPHFPQSESFSGSALVWHDREKIRAPLSSLCELLMVPGLHRHL
jgi:hypothetical protein